MEARAGNKALNGQVRGPVRFDDLSQIVSKVSISSSGHDWK